MRTWAGIALALCVGCGSADHAAFVDSTAMGSAPVDSDAGPAGTGGAGGMRAEAQAATGGAAGSGGKAAAGGSAGAPVGPTGIGPGEPCADTSACPQGLYCAGATQSLCLTPCHPHGSCGDGEFCVGTSGTHVVSDGCADSTPGAIWLCSKTAAPSGGC